MHNPDALAQSAQLRLSVKRGEGPRKGGDQDAPCPTFQEFAERHWESIRHGWRNPKHATQWINTLRTYAFPLIGDLRLDAIETRHIVEILEPIWLKKNETATRLRQRIESVLAAARVRGYRQGENPAAWHNHLDLLLPAVSRRLRHHPALPWREMPEFFGELVGNDSISSRALRFFDSHRRAHRRGHRGHMGRDRPAQPCLDRAGAAHEVRPGHSVRPAATIRVSFMSARSQAGRTPTGRCRPGCEARRG